MNIQSMTNLRKAKLHAGGPGSGPRPGGGHAPDTALLNKFHGFMTRHNPDMGNGRGVENYEHAANFLHNLTEHGKTTMHNFFDHMDKASGLGKKYSRVDHRGNLRMKAGGPGSGRHAGFGSLAEKYANFAVRHNPDMGNGRGVENFEHAAQFLNNLGHKSKVVMHNFFDHMDKAVGPSAVFPDPIDVGRTTRWYNNQK